MRRLLPLLIVLSACLLLSACGGDDSGSKAEATATAEAVETPPGETTSGCKKVDKPKAKPDGGQKKPAETLDKAKTYTATVATSCGDFTITLDVKRAPKTSASFVSLAKSGFYDGTIFHRIVPGFVIQGGDPTGTGTGGPGYSVKEAPPKDLQYLRGVVAMAKTGSEPAGTSGSQFFVVTGEDAQLPPDYALLGKVSGGEEVVDTIATVETDPSTEQPVNPVVIDKVTISEK
jgi:peptidyl-prolyl cis-trans isomerase B (cyclophilin B)